MVTIYYVSIFKSRLDSFEKRLDKIFKNWRKYLKLKYVSNIDSVRGISFNKSDHFTLDVINIPHDIVDITIRFLQKNVTQCNVEDIYNFLKKQPK